jgi:hypothetical protein
MAITVIEPAAASVTSGGLTIASAAASSVTLVASGPVMVVLASCGISSAGLNFYLNENKFKYYQCP